MNANLPYMATLLFGLVIGSGATYAIVAPHSGTEHYSTDQTFESAGQESKSNNVVALRSHEDTPVRKAVTKEEEKAEPETSRTLTEVELVAIINGLGPDWKTPVLDVAEGYGEFIGGVRHGEWILDYPAKDFTDTGKFVFGAKHGRWTIHDRNGNLLRDRVFVAGKIEGELRDRDSIVDPWRYYDYKNGELVD